MSKAHEQEQAREDLRAGVIACAVINANRGKGRPVMPHDIFPHLATRRRRQTPAEIWRRVEALNVLLGGKPPPRKE